ncbi:translation initiation factor IF-2 [Oscillatoriales cyanobacterium LEGE 11467]|uniref:Translation initiation factor IF-2 n=1 Tax=Zarconia navalis LEGE 11467 TaxID=1828826 RepID=A0A928VYA4_9CYAN|nr:translation initiation factor IF-2 [Zarconia navalis]MBE9041508.1 translation initiation factor IF-2 [Zarconia navalis LEGE 11467]
MSNGKVRIYELSHELELKNKDILTICEQLDIAVKSHSSTITSDDADRIRSAADRIPSSTSVKPVPKPSNKHSKDSQKPQILVVKPQSPRPASSTPTGTSPKPQPPLARPTSESLEPPARNNISPSPASQSQSEVQTVAPEEARPPSSSPPVSKPTPEAKETDDDGVLLLAPPVDRSKKVEGQPTANRPVLKPQKSDKSDRDTSDSNGRPQEKEAATVQIATKLDKPRPSRPTRPKPAAEAASSGAKLPDLQRPQQKIVRVNTSETSDVEKSTDDKSDATEIEDPILKAKPTRPAKRVEKKRKEEEDDVQELLNKGANKTKRGRRLKPIDDDDDDIDSELLANSVSSAQVSLSIARPPKSPSSAKPTAAVTSAVKAKKPPSRDHHSSRGGRNNRRNSEPKVERPEFVAIADNMTVQELANALAVADTEIVKRLFMKGIAVNVTQTLDVATATLVAEELGVLVETPEAESEARKGTEMIDEGDLENLQHRPPVVTIMGHVDHGKTTLLDTIRQTKVAQGEAGGITQHTGAYHVDVTGEDRETQQIVFLDTPGHQAFTKMRARGARVTDIAILVVAADDGVQPQTIEAIDHAKAAEVPIVVAINKIDKEEAQPDRIKQELMEHGLVPEEWGGETIMVPVSAIQGENLDNLLEMILLVADVEELSANPDRPAKGTVIEAHLDKARGSVATLLVQNGTLRVGDVLVAGSVFGKVKAMMDDRGERVEAATPSFAVEVLGMNEVPAAGDVFEVYLNEKEARAIADREADKQRQARLITKPGRTVSLNSLSEAKRQGELKELNLIIKADVQGSLEAISGSLQQLPQDEVQLRVLMAAPGEVTETDVDLAAASAAVIIGFNTTFASGARQAAENEGVDVREYSVIYRLLDDIQGAMEGLLDPELVEEPLGQAEVRAVFAVGRGTVAGCYVQSGQLVRNCKVRVLRDSKVIHEGILDSLKRVKDDVKEVNSGYECGIGLQSFNGWNEGDTISAYRMVTKRRTLATR